MIAVHPPYMFLPTYVFTNPNPLQLIHYAAKIFKTKRKKQKKKWQTYRQGDSMHVNSAKMRTYGYYYLFCEFLKAPRLLAKSLQNVENIREKVTKNIDSLSADLAYNRASRSPFVGTLLYSTMHCFLFSL